MVKNGALKVGRVAGVDVFVHWTWAIIVYLYVQDFSKAYTSQWWVAGQIAAFIGMVTLHDAVQIVFGKLAGGTVSEVCISFMGRGSNLVPPQRPGPIMLTYGGGVLAYAAMLGVTVPLFVMAYLDKRWNADVAYFSFITLIINCVLLAWTAAPVYPLAGGRILRALLWLVMGRERSLQVACVLGLLGTIGIVVLAVYMQSIWYGIMAVMIGIQCFSGFKEAKMLGLMRKLPRREDVACPHCKEHPIAVWSIKCPCGEELDPFETRGMCGVCGSVTAFMACPMCTQRSAIVEWFGPVWLFEVQGVGSDDKVKG